MSQRFELFGFCSSSVNQIHNFFRVFVSPKEAGRMKISRVLTTESRKFSSTSSSNLTNSMGNLMIQGSICEKLVSRVYQQEVVL